VPLDGRYYDLRDADTQAWQASLARQHGVSGFCYYHYWFNGRRLLEKPVELMLARGQPDMPFCLAWANEPWTRTWDGGDRHVLMPQEYGDKANWSEHFAALLPALRDPRYIRVGGKPLFIIYRSGSIPQCDAMVAHFRRLAVDAGLAGLHLVRMLTAVSHGGNDGSFDASIEFEPGYTLYHDTSRLERRRELMARHRGKLVRWLTGSAPHALNSHNYVRVWHRIMRRRLAANRYPGAFVDWDNSPRRTPDRAAVFRHFSLETFERGLAVQVDKARRASAPFVFVNAWNEWAEGAYLEPDEHHGTALLEAVARVMKGG
jgi:hypothetical protein